MADDVTLPGTGSKIATDDDGTRQYQWVKLVWGPDDTFNKVDTASGKALPTAPQAGELHIGEVGGNTAVPSASFTRPANTTAYASGQLVANNTTAGSVTPLSLTVARKNAGTGVVSGLRLSKSGTSVTNAAFRVHVYRNSPTVTNGDGGTFLAAGNTAVEIGYFDVTMDQVYSDGAKGFASFGARAFATAAGSQNLYALIEARGGYTPVSGETFTLELEALRD